MEGAATFIVTLAVAGAVASWVAGAVFYARTLAALDDDPRLKWLSVVAWPFATGRLKGAAGEEAAKVNKAMLAFIICVTIAIAAFSVATNLHRLSK